MHIIPVLAVVIFSLAHQCYSRDNNHQHGVEDSSNHRNKNHNLVSKNMLNLEINVSISSINGIADFHLYLKTNGSDICYNWAGKDQSLLIVVNSKVEHVKERMVARATWLKNYGGGRTPNVRVVFVVGKPDSQETIDRLSQENKQYGDIVWTHVPDTYRYYESLKAVAILHWILHECKTPKFVLKVADDSIVNVPAVLRFVEQQIKSSNTIWGFKHNSSLPVGSKEQSRESTSKHAYLMTGDSIKTLYYGALKQKPYMSTESIFLTGLVAKSVNISVIHNENFRGITVSVDISNNINTATKCRYAKDHMIFLKSADRYQWPHIVSSFNSCPYNFV